MMWLLGKNLTLAKSDLLNGRLNGRRKPHSEAYASPYRWRIYIAVRLVPAQEGLPYSPPLNPGEARPRVNPSSLEFMAL